MSIAKKFESIKNNLEVLTSGNKKKVILSSPTINYLEKNFILGVAKGNKLQKLITFYYPILNYLVNHKNDYANKKKLNINDINKLKKISDEEETNNKLDQVLRDNRTKKERHGQIDINQKIPVEKVIDLGVRVEKTLMSDEIIKPNTEIINYLNTNFINIITKKSAKYWNKINNADILLKINMYYLTNNIKDIDGVIYNKLTSVFKYTSSINLSGWYKLTGGDINIEFSPHLIAPKYFQEGLEYFNQKIIKKNTLLSTKLNFTEMISAIIELTKPNNLNGSGDTIISRIVGYQIKILHRPDRKIDENIIKGLLAYGGFSNESYHKLTCVSTRDQPLCLWDTFAYILIGDHVLRKTKTNNELNEEFNKLPESLQKNIRDGLLYESYIELTKLYKTIMFVKFWFSDIPSIKFDKGNMTILEDEKELEGRLIGLYGNKHIAPCKYKTEEHTKNIEEKGKNKKDNGFRMKPINMKKLNNSKFICNGWDVETYGQDANSYCVTVSGDKNNDFNDEKFYGKNCIKEFCEYINKIATPTKTKKTNKKVKLPKIMMYGFNNSRFDNLLIWKYLYKLNPNTKMNISNNSIKYIKYYNVFIYDISLFYKIGGLRETAKAFKLEKEKGVFPYNFYKDKDFYDDNGEINFNYVGSPPPLYTWKNKRDYIEYINKNGFKFNLKEYTEKYCLLDAELGKELGNIHLKNANGQLPNGRYFDVRLCPTIGSMAIKIYRQGFQKETIYESPLKIQDKERRAYFGGNTQVYKMLFDKKSHKKLYCYDLNSSYPASMVGIMPYKYISTDTILKEFNKTNKDEIIDYYLYNAKSKGGEHPNLVVKTKKNITLNVQETDYNYHWGIELKEAINRDFTIEVNEINTYEGKNIFSEYIEFLYNERLKNKGVNDSLTLFYKNTTNSSYGKYGQRKFNNKEVCSSVFEIQKIISNPNNKICDFTDIGDLTIVEYDNIEDESRAIGSLVRLASYITAKSRTVLNEMIRIVGYEHVYYCDTDSIFTDVPLDDKYISSKILGKWKLEYEAEDGIFLAKKLYHIQLTDKKEKCAGKGIPNNLLKKSTYERLKEGKSVPIMIESMFFRSIEDGIKIKPQIREIKQVLTTRIYDNNGNSKAYKDIAEFEKLNFNI